MRGRAVQERNPAVDLCRVSAVVVVVLGHWLMQGLSLADGRLVRTGMLSVTESAWWTHPATWLLQVMPVLFLVGGYGSLRSWRRARQEGVPYAAWLQRRTVRISMPLVPLLLLWAALGPAAGPLGLSTHWLRIADRASLVPLWFLAVYLVMVATTPLSARAWERYRFGSVAVPALGAGLVDLVSLWSGWEVLGALNLVLVWGTLHQLGHAWSDGAVQGRLAGWTLAGLGSLACFVLVRWGPYGVSMVGVSGFGVDNAAPPRVTLLLLGLAQAGVAVALEASLRRLAGRPAVRAVLGLLGPRLVTVYLWHLPVLAALAGVALALDGVGLRTVPGSSAWWWDRLAWIPVLALGTAVVAAILGPLERVGQRSEPRPLAPVLLHLLVLVGCLALLSEGSMSTGPVGALLALAPVVATLALVGREAGRPRPTRTLGPDVPARPAGSWQ